MRFAAGKNSARNYSVFLGPCEECGIMQRLSKAFDDMGIQNHFYCLCDTLEAEKSIRLPNDIYAMKLYWKHTDKIKTSCGLQKRLYVLMQMFDCIWIFLHCLLRHDQFIYIFGHTIFYFNDYLRKIRYHELWILKLFRKKIIMLYIGSDSRAPYCGVDIYKNLYRATRAQAKRVGKVEKYADYVIDNPASSHFHRKKFINFFQIGVPMDESQIVEKDSTGLDAEKGNRVVILHAPSVRKAKGTEDIEKIISELSRKYSIDYIEISGMPHDEVLNALKKADIVVDQAYTDTPLAALASEACINGVAVIVGGYYSEEIKKVFPSANLPTVYCMPEEIGERIELLINDARKRVEIGKRGKRYVLDHTMAPIVAKKLICMFEDVVPKEWFYDPEDATYLFGLGMRKDRFIERLIPMIDEYGFESLCLPSESKLLQGYKKLYHDCKDVK